MAPLVLAAQTTGVFVNGVWWMSRGPSEMTGDTQEDH